MKVKNCNNCPFRVDKYDDWSTGYDSLTYCNLAHFNGEYLNLAVYNRNDENLQPIITPKECPLRDGNLIIELEEINK